MKKVRRITAVAAAAMAIVGMSSLVAAPASAAKKIKGPHPVSALLKKVDVGDKEWVSVKWKTDKKVCDFKLHVYNNDKVDIYHPWGLPFATLEGDDTLKKNEIDSTAFRVVAHSSKPKQVLLATTVSFNYCGDYDETQYRNSGLVLRVRG